MIKTSKEILKSKFVGSFLGTAVGDAMGARYEGLPYGISFTKTNMGRYTDDTQMMIGIAESLIENKGFNGKRMAYTFIKNFDPSRGYGLGPPLVFRWISSGEAWDKASEKLFGGEGSFGNGSAMRVAPIGCFYHDDPDKLRKIAYKSSQITHSHELGRQGAALQAYAIALAINSGPCLNRDYFLEKLDDFAEHDVYKKKLKTIESLLGLRPSRSKVVKELGNGIEAFNSVPTAIYCFAWAESFQESILFAISLGGDTDTIAAMTGAISGAFYGVEGIPGSWKNELEDGEKGKSYIEKLAKELWSIKYG